MKQLEVHFYAQLKEQAGHDVITVQTSAASVRQLYTELSDRLGLHIPWDNLKAARNDDFCAGDSVIGEGDVIAFMPPMSGG